MALVEDDRLTEMELMQLVNELGGWLNKEQIKNISLAVASGKLSAAKYRSLSDQWVDQGFDNGGFTPREQYALEFANRY